MNKHYILVFLLLIIGCSTSKQAPLALIKKTDQERKDIYKKVTPYGLSRISITNYWRDSLIYNSDTILMNYSPLLEFDGITRAIVHGDETMITGFKAGKSNYWMSESPIFHCDREYTACWYILNKRLYLGKVSPREFYVTKQAPHFFDGPQRINQKKVKKRGEQATDRKYKDNLIFADWVNGTIDGEVGERNSPIPWEWLLTENASCYKITLRFVQGVLVEFKKEISPHGYWISNK